MNITVSNDSAMMICKRCKFRFGKRRGRERMKERFRCRGGVFVRCC